MCRGRWGTRASGVLSRRVPSLVATSLKIVSPLANLPLYGICLTPIIVVPVRNSFPRIKKLPLMIEHQVLTGLRMIEVVMMSYHPGSCPKVVQLRHSVAVAGDSAVS